MLSLSQVSERSPHWPPSLYLLCANNLFQSSLPEPSFKHLCPVAPLVKALLQTPILSKLKPKLLTASFQEMPLNFMGTQLHCLSCSLMYFYSCPSLNYYFKWVTPRSYLYCFSIVLSSSLSSCPSAVIPSSIQSSKTLQLVMRHTCVVNLPCPANAWPHSLLVFSTILSVMYTVTSCISSNIGCHYELTWRYTVCIILSIFRALG